AVHPVRHRDDLPVPGRRAAEGVRDLRADRGRRVRRAAAGGVRLRVAQRSPGMEMTRQRLGGGSGGEFRARQLSARRMLMGELDGPELDQYVQERLWT